MHPTYGELRPVTPLASVLLEPNPSPMTLEGTNTWVLRAPDEEDCVVVDPGDDDPEHLERVAGHGPVALVLLTHRHHDHAARRAALRAAHGRPGAGAGPVAGAGLRSARRGRRRGGRGLRAARAGDARAHVGLAVVPARRPGDGARGAHRRHRARPRHHRHRPPGRRAGALPRLAAPARRAGRRHDRAPRARPRAARRPVRRRGTTSRTGRSAWTRCGRRWNCSARTRSPRQVVEHVYADVDEVLWAAAELSVRAQLEYLRG